jgi:ATP-dependent protease ClpP protease subunit
MEFRCQVKSLLTTLAAEALRTAANAPAAGARRLKARAVFLGECSKLSTAELLPALRLGRIEPRQFALTNPLCNPVGDALSTCELSRDWSLLKVTLGGEIIDLPRGFFEALKVARAVEIVVDSPGGDATVAAKMLALLEEAGVPVTVRIHLAASAAAFLACLCPGRRSIACDGQIMLHAPAHVLHGDAARLRQHADTLDALAAEFVGAFVARTGQSRTTVEGWLAPGKDCWFDAEAAVAAGLADAVF